MRVEQVLLVRGYFTCKGFRPRARGTSLCSVFFLCSRFFPVFTANGNHSNKPPTRRVIETFPELKRTTLCESHCYLLFQLRPGNRQKQRSREQLHQGCNICHIFSFNCPNSCNSLYSISVMKCYILLYFVNSFLLLILLFIRDTYLSKSIGLNVLF